MEFAVKAFRFVVYSLVIYGCFEDNVAKIRAEDTSLEEKANKGGGIVFLDKEFPSISNPMKGPKKYGERKESYTADDEDGEKETDDSGSGDEIAYMQSDDPSSDDQSLNAQSSLNAGTKSVNISPTRVLDQAVSAMSAVSAKVVTIAPSSNTTVNIAPTTPSDGNSSNTVATNPLYSTPYMSTTANTIDTIYSIHARPFMSSQLGSSGPSSSAVVSRSTIANPTGIATKQSTVETTTKAKDGGNVETQKDPPLNEAEGRKTLFGFVTIEILVALLAGAACAVILLIFLVHRLKKRNEGSYELQESLSLKTGGYNEEKEVFV